MRLAYRDTAEAGSARVSMEMTGTGLRKAGGSTAPMAFEMTASGVVDFQSGDTRLTMVMEPFGEMEVRGVGGAVYQRLPGQLTARIPGSRPWVSVDLDAMMREQYGAGMTGMGPGGRGVDQLEYLEGVSDSVERVGRKDVRGVPTTSYRATIDLRKALKDDPRTRYEEAHEQLGTDRLPTEVWLDGENRVRRLVMDVPVENPGDDGRMEIVQEYYDFGVPVNVAPPPAGQTASMEEVMSGMSGRAGAQ